jgi:hypothetical protein
LYLELSRSQKPQRILKPLLDPGGRFASETTAAEVSELKQPLSKCFRSEAVKNL